MRFDDLGQNMMSFWRANDEEIRFEEGASEEGCQGY